VNQGREGIESGRPESKLQDALQEQGDEMTASRPSVWSPAELLQHLDQGSRFAILDVRNRDEFDAWRIEGKAPIQTCPASTCWT